MIDLNEEERNKRFLIQNDNHHMVTLVEVGNGVEVRVNNIAVLCIDHEESNIDIYGAGSTGYLSGLNVSSDGIFEVTR